ncbi:stonin-1 isoform X1 [Siphateles boraxobius]|uniref:stonin-1 isoform X1 n=1 Tax=Siphateles boraxobius TaxID=180520 RepID=UPI0040634A77
MCSTNHPANWVTFDDEATTFSSPPKSLNSPGSSSGSIPRPNGLKLVLPSLGSESWIFSSAIESPSLEFGLNGSSQVPSNTPRCTPVGSTPTAPDFSRCLTSFSQKDSMGNTEGTGSLKASQDEPGHFNPFWGEEEEHKRLSWTSSSDSDSGPSLPRFFIRTKDGDQPTQDHLQYSYSYICHKLEQLRTEEKQLDGNDVKVDRESRPSGAGKDKAIKRCLSSFVPQGLFLSQRRHGWSLMLRIPEKKNRMSSRQWGPVYLRLCPGALLQLFYEQGLEKPFRELQLHAYTRLSALKLERYGEPRRIATVKLEHVSYTERKRYHPKLEVTHEPEVEQLLKFGTTEYGDLEDLLASIEEELNRLPVPHLQHKHYEEQELSLQISDRVWMRRDQDGATLECSAITQIHCLAFLNGAVECFLTLNDLGLLRQVPAYRSDEDEVWMEITDYSLHGCVREAEFKEKRVMRFSPPDGCRVELMRFRTASLCYEDPPLSTKALLTVQGACIQLQVFLNVLLGFPHPTGGSETVCENVVVRVPFPGDWVKVPNSMSLLRQKSLKARMNRNTCLGSAHVAESPSVMHVSVGAAKYENVHRAIVWRIDRLPPKNVAVDQPQSLACKLELSSDQELPEGWMPWVSVECEVAGVLASQTRVRSLGIECDVQPQKQLSSRAYYHCQVEMEKKLIETECQKRSGCATQ